MHRPFTDQNRPWVDALDPTLPSDPPTTIRALHARAPQHPHKLILSGASLAAGALVVGYLAAFLLL